MQNPGNIIIAGANKCGTTSLFRYLSAHPKVTGSSVKEARFFWNERDFSNPAAASAYRELFGRSPPADTVFLEATPNYLDGGLRVATAIKSVLQDPRLIFLFRDPVDRLVSYYRSKRGFKHAPTFGMEFQEFTAIATDSISRDPSELSVRDQHLRHEVAKGFYADRLKQYLSVFPSSSMLILFYDDLATDTADTTKKAARFAGLDADFFDHFDFSVENRSRAHRSASLRTWASLANRRLEPVLNRTPALRRWTRALYDALNTVRSESFHPNPDALDGLRRIYAGPNEQFADLLQGSFGYDDLPTWLRSTAKSN
jgi:hypothetical protein